MTLTPSSIALRFFTALFPLALYFVWANPATGQTPSATNTTNVGFPMNGVFDGSDFENVQIANGGLQIEIPLFSVPGRNGLDVTYKYVYANKQWTARETYHARTDTYIADIRPEQGQMAAGIIMHTAGPFGYSVTSRYTTYCGNDPTFYYTNFVLTEPNGKQHHFLPDPVYPGGRNCAQAIPSLMYADDGSGWGFPMLVLPLLIRDKNRMR